MTSLLKKVILVLMLICLFAVTSPLDSSAEQSISGIMRYNIGSPMSDDINAFYVDASDGETYILWMCDDWRLVAGCALAEQVVMAVGKSVTVYGRVVIEELTGPVMHVERLVVH